MPFVVCAEACDTSKINIESISLVEKTDNIEGYDSATADGKIISFDLSMSEVGDIIKYKVVVKNDSAEDFEFDVNGLKTTSDYIGYTLESDDKSNVVKANTSRVYYLNIEYKKEVPSSAFESGMYQDKSAMTIQLLSGNRDVSDSIKNPNTGAKSYIVMFIIMLLLGKTLYIYFTNKNYIKIIILVVGTFIIIPISTYALCKCEVRIESNVKIIDDRITGVIYRNNKIILGNNTNIGRGYLLKSNGEYVNYFASLDECEKANENGNVCEKVNKSLMNYEGFSLDKNTLNNNRYLRHDVENNIIKSSYVCLVAEGTEYCMKGGDNGASYPLNSQFIKDFSSRNSYCVLGISNNETRCEGSYGMDISAELNGSVSSCYFFGSCCFINEDGSSSC